MEELISAERERVVLGVDMVYMDSVARILDIEVAVVLAGVYGREYMVALVGSDEERTALVRFTCEVRVAAIATRGVRGDMGFYVTVALPAGTLNAQADAIREQRTALSDQHCEPQT